MRKQHGTVTSQIWAWRHYVCMFMHEWQGVSVSVCVCAWRHAVYKAAKHEAGVRVSMYATACAPTGVPNEGLPALLLLITMYCF